MFKSLYSILSLIFLMAIGLLQPAFASQKSCGISQRCADGYYCTGAIGDSNSGVCVANALNTVMCRSISYIESDILNYFFLLGAVFAGIYMFLGKFTMVTFIQIVLGITVLKGSATLITSITGSSAGLCSFKQALNCIEDTVGAKVYSDETYIRNFTKVNITSNYVTSASKTSCLGLECVTATCLRYSVTTKVTNGVETKECSLSGGRTSDSMVLASNANNVDFSVINCPASFKVKCEAVVGSFKRDYFNCTSCVGEKFAAEAPSVWGIATCKDLVKKQIK